MASRGRRGNRKFCFANGNTRISQPPGWPSLRVTESHTRCYADFLTLIIGQREVRVWDLEDEAASSLEQFQGLTGVTPSILDAPRRLYFVGVM